MARPLPFDLVFGDLAPTWFPAIRAAVDEAGIDPRDREGWLLLRPAVALLRTLRPEGGLGTAVDGLVALAHHAWLAWRHGAMTCRLNADHLGRVLAGVVPPTPGQTPTAYYIQVPERQVWAQVVPQSPHEPLDGCFVFVDGDGRLHVLGLFGVRPERAGFSLAEADGARPAPGPRPDGTPAFEPLLPGGADAGLHSIADNDELLDFGWRAHLLAGALVG